MEERTKSGKDPRDPSMLRILMLCAGAFAVEAVYMIEEGYAIPAMLATGLPETVASAMWAVGPLLGLVFQGYLGSASDRCTCSWGKRRPFIVCLAVCAFTATLLFPYGTFLSGSVMGLSEKSGGLFVMVFTAFMFVAMDFFLDALQSPLRAYLLDSVPTEGSEQANYTFTALLCTGAIAGSLIAGIPWSKFGGKGGGGEEGENGSNSKGASRQIEVVYGIATILFAVCTLLCLNSIQEKNPSTHESPPVEKQLTLPLATRRKTVDMQNLFADDYSSPTLAPLKQPQSHVVSSDDLKKVQSQTRVVNGINFVPVPPPLPQLKATPTKLTPSTGCLSRFFGHIYDDICGTILFSKYISSHFFRLCVTVLFNWVAFLSMMLYFTSFMGQVVYGGSPHAPSGEEGRELFDRGVRIGFLVLLFQDVVSTVACLSMKWLSNLFGIRRLYVGGLVAYVVVCLVTATWPTLLNAIALQVVTGLVYSNLQSLPYTLISHYEV